MKTVASVVSQMLGGHSEPKIVHMMAACGFYKRLKKPTLSTELTCLICGNHAHYAVFVDPKKSNERVWLCADAKCQSNHVKPRRFPDPCDEDAMRKYNEGHPDYHDTPIIVD